MLLTESVGLSASAQKRAFPNRCLFPTTSGLQRRVRARRPRSGGGVNLSRIYSHIKIRQDLSVSVDLLDRTYETGCNAIAGFKQNMSIFSDELLPQDDYAAAPQST